MEIRYKDKPMNKKKLIHKVIIAASAGVAFGITFSITLLLFKPLFKDAFSTDNKENNIVLQVGEEEKTDGPKVDKVDSPPDSEELQYALYNVGVQINKSLVGINLASNEGFEGEDVNSEISCGIIFTKTETEVFILTTPNAINGNKQAQVTFYSGDTTTGDVVGVDPETRIAVVSVPVSRMSAVSRDEITVASLGNSDVLNRGQFVIAVGSPLGQMRSIVTGHFTSVSDTVGYVDMEYSRLKTDIASTTATSGFLINKKGAIVGIILPNEEVCGQVSAIAISSFAEMLEKLCNAEKLPFIGIRIKTIGSSAARIYGIVEGVFVKEVEINSPAAEAGIQKGDIIISIGKNEIRNGKQLGSNILEAAPDSKLTFTIMRASGGKFKTISRKVLVQLRD